jgi:NADPH:quinone reductase
MRAIIARTLGGPEHLTLVTDYAEPVAKSGQVVVSIAATALNFPDILTLQGTYQHKQDPPYVPGMEGAGTVTAVGPGGDARLIGRRVMFGARGTLAERVAVPVGALLDVPPAWTMAQAAGYPIAATTAYHALVHRAGLLAGETLLVHGAAGGMGHMAVKLGRAFGARVIATASGPERMAQVQALGADVVLDSRGADLAERIKAVCVGGVNVVFDPVGGGVFTASLKAAAFGARIAVVGFTAGEPNTVRTNYALIKGLSILGVRAGEAGRHDATVAADYARELPRLAAVHDLAPHIGATFKLAEAAEAFACLASRTVAGKVVLEVASV